MSKTRRASSAWHVRQRLLSNQKRAIENIRHDAVRPAEESLGTIPSHRRQRRETSLCLNPHATTTIRRRCGSLEYRRSKRTFDRLAMEDGRQNPGRRRLPRSSLVPALFESEVCAAQRLSSRGRAIAATLIYKSILRNTLARL